LRNPLQRKKHYLAPFGISEFDLNKFVESIYAIVHNGVQDIKLIAVVFDKRFYKDETRCTVDASPLLKSAQILFERLHYTNQFHVVVFDQFDTDLKVRREGHHKKIVDIAHGKGKMRKAFVSKFDKIVDIKFIESRRENFIQLADLCAYNIYRQFVHYGRDWQGEGQGTGQKMSGYGYFHRIRCNFLFHPRTRKVPGCGLVCVPDIGKCNWDLLDGCGV
jgi:hypothetical protein